MIQDCYTMNSISKLTTISNFWVQCNPGHIKVSFSSFVSWRIKATADYINKRVLEIIKIKTNCASWILVDYGTHDNAQSIINLNLKSFYRVIYT